ncbi:MAG: F0F1 ATP synthase subunit gamma [Synergistaceae bacterium]|nr:F0F1 ATP synthase subunit gamma [Synergistaceae bacterium]
MSETTASLRRKIDSASDLQSVVRTMKSLAASSIGQYERSVAALAEYFSAVELGLGVAFRNASEVESLSAPEGRATEEIRAVVFGSDQGLVGQFNETISEYAIENLQKRRKRIRIWSVGERVLTRLNDAGFEMEALFAVPGSAEGIIPLVGKILLSALKSENPAEGAEFHLFYNSPLSRAGYAPKSIRLLPLDSEWIRQITEIPWPSKSLPEILDRENTTFGGLLREYFFVSLFRACAESLASENASRLSAMERADRNIDDLLEDLGRSYHRLRQSGIDAELFDLLAGYEVMSK